MGKAAAFEGHISPLLSWIMPGCRLVAVAIPACLVGVALITQPEFLGFKEAQQRNLWGILFASGQVIQVTCMSRLRGRYPEDATQHLNCFAASSTYSLFKILRHTPGQLSMSVKVA